MELAIILIEFALFCLTLFVISFQLWRLKVDQATFVQKLNDLSASIDAAVAKIGSASQPIDFQPLGDAVDAMKAKLDAANPPA